MPVLTSSYPNLAPCAQPPLCLGQQVGSAPSVPVAAADLHPSLTATPFDCGMDSATGSKLLLLKPLS